MVLPIDEEIITIYIKKNIETLDLSNKTIIDLHIIIGKLTNLKWLELSNTNITYCPVEIGQLTLLTRLNLSRNKIYHVQQDFI